SGQSAKPLQGQAVKGIDLIGICVTGSRKDDRSRDEARGFPAAARITKLVKSANIKRRAGEQDHGQGELTNDESMAEALMTATAGRPARAALEGVVDVESQREKGGSQTKRDRGYRGSYKGPREDMPVEREGKTFAVVRESSRRDPV